MNLAIARIPGADVSLEYAQVIAPTEDAYTIKTPFGVFEARRAAGCLLRPEPADTVLCATDARGQRFILTVLVRADTSAPARVEAEGDMEIGAPACTLSLRADEVRLTADSSLGLAAAELDLLAAKANVRTASLHVAGDGFFASFGRAKTLLGAAEQVVGRLISRARRVYRRVDDFEDARFGRLRINAAHSMDLEADRARLQARQTVDVEAAKINLG